MTTYEPEPGGVCPVDVHGHSLLNCVDLVDKFTLLVLQVLFPLSDVHFCSQSLRLHPFTRRGSGCYDRSTVDEKGSSPETTQDFRHAFALLALFTIVVKYKWLVVLSFVPLFRCLFPCTEKHTTALIETFGIFR
jgi:hypothetical protein